MILATGEELPTGRSLNARIYTVEVKTGDVDVQRLTDAQRHGEAGVLAQAMAGFIKWLASQRDAVETEIWKHTRQYAHQAGERRTTRPNPRRDRRPAHRG